MTRPFAPDRFRRFQRIDAWLVALERYAPPVYYLLAAALGAVLAVGVVIALATLDRIVSP